MGLRQGWGTRLYNICIMRKRIVKEVRATLPPAIIFLDDLEEIQELVRSSMGNDYVLDGFLYEVNEEFTVDSPGDLDGSKGSAKRLKMSALWHQKSDGSRLVPRHSTILSLRASGISWVEFPECLQMKEQEYCAHLREIFEARKRAVHAFFAAVSPQIEVPVFLLLPALAGLAASIILHPWFRRIDAYAIAHARNPQDASVLGLIGSAALGVLACVFLLFALSPILIASYPFASRYRVKYRYEKTQHLELKRSRKELIEKIGLAVLGTILGVIGTVFVQWLGMGNKH
jgi:hypothetical protein